jgi:hypothetical protein
MPTLSDRPPLSTISQDGLDARLKNLPQVNWAQQFGQTEGGRFGGNGAQWTASSVEYDRQGNLVIAGNVAEGSAWLSKLRADGTKLWEKTWRAFSGNDNVAVVDTAIDNAGNIFLAGRFAQRLDFGVGLSGLAIQLTTARRPEGAAYIPEAPVSGYDSDLFVAKFNAEGQVLWAKSFGSFDGFENVVQLVADSQGNAYFTGLFNQANTGFGQNAQGQSIRLSPLGGSDIFVTKLDTSGQTLWAKNFGGNSVFPNLDYISYLPTQDTVYDLAIDSQDRLYLAGQIFGSEMNLPQLQGGNRFLAQLNANGDVLNTKALAIYGSLISTIQLAVFGSDRLYVAANVDNRVAYYTANNPLPSDLSIAFINAGVILQQFDLTGSSMAQGWQKSFELGNGWGHDLAIDSTGSLYLTGNFFGNAATFGLGANGKAISLDLGHGGYSSRNGYIAKFDANGTAIWAKGFGGVDTFGYHLAVNNVGTIALAGSMADFYIPFMSGDPGEVVFGSKSYVNELWAGRDGAGNLVKLSQDLSGDAFLITMPIDQTISTPQKDSEVLWYNKVTGELEFWVLRGTEYVKALSPLPRRLEPEGWELVGRGDFDRDGDSDLFWYNRLSGLSSLWKLDGTNFVEASTVVYGDGSLMQVPQPGNWQVQAIGDFSQDGWLDLLWLNTVTGQSGYWSMEGNRLVSAYMNSLVIGDAANWQVTGVGDYDKDGDLDLYWYNRNTGDNGFWRLEGMRLIEGVRPFGNSQGRLPIGTTIYGGRDIDGDGFLDLYTYNSQSGDYRPIYLERLNLTLRPELTIAYLPAPANFEIRGVKDFDNDGSIDFLLYNPSSGKTVIWNRAKPVIKLDQAPIRLKSQGWEIVS